MVWLEERDIIVLSGSDLKKVSVSKTDSKWKIVNPGWRGDGVDKGELH